MSCHLQVNTVEIIQIINKIGLSAYVANIISLELMLLLLIRVDCLFCYYEHSDHVLHWIQHSDGQIVKKTLQFTYNFIYLKFKSAIIQKKYVTFHCIFNIFGLPQNV